MKSDKTSSSRGVCLYIVEIIGAGHSQWSRVLDGSIQTASPNSTPMVRRDERIAPSTP
jgi:hypothetical protein